MRFLLKMFVLGFIGLAILPSFAPEEYRRDGDSTTVEGVAADQVLRIDQPQS